MGNVAVKNSWDSYKGGFELFLTLSKHQKFIPQISLDHYRSQIAQIIRDRLQIALKVKLHSGEFIESYILFLRINFELNDLDFKISLNDILGLAALEDILQNSNTQDSQFYLDSKIDQNVRVLANKFLPEKFLLENNANCKIIYYNSSSQEFSSYEEAIKKLKFFDYT